MIAGLALAGLCLVAAGVVFLTRMRSREAGIGDHPMREERSTESGHVLDPRVITELQLLDPGGRQRLFAQLATAYRESAPRLVQSMESGLEKADPTLLADAAHALKSSSAALGAAKLAEFCLRVEALGRRGSTQDASALVEAIGVELGTVLGALEDWSQDRLTSTAHPR